MKSISIQIPTLIIAALVVSGGAFYGGYSYAKAFVKKDTVGTMMQFRQGMGAGAGAGAAAGFGARQGSGARALGAGGMGGFVNGEVASKTDSGFTVKLRDGGSKVVVVASSTTIGKMTSGSMEDIAAGTAVVVTGASNSDGSVTATMVQIRPEGEVGMPGFGRMPEGIATGTRMEPPQIQDR